MIIYLVKSIILLALLFGLYKFLLENEKMHRFNRFFLLFALVFGLTAPLISFEVTPEQSIAGIKMQHMERVGNAPAEAISRSVEPLILPKQEAALNTEISPVVASESSRSLSTTDILLGIYGLVTLFLLIRFAGGLFEIRSKVKSGSLKETDDATLVLLNEPITPQSFFNFIFLDREQFESGKIETEVLDHELIHVRQLHSFDVLLIEFLKVIFWFNPLLYFFKHSIQLNHEFLADESVVNNGSSVSDYQNLLLRFSTGNKPMSTTSSINYSLTKKRFIMMSSSKSILRALPKMLLAVSMLSMLTFISCTDTRSIPEIYTSEDLAAMFGTTYSDVALHYDGKRSEELGIPLTLGAQFTSSGELFTGTQSIYYKENDSLYMELYYKDGINVGSVSFRNGEIFRIVRGIYLSMAHTREMYVNEVLVYEDVPPAENGDELGRNRLWHRNGQLAFEGFYTGFMGNSVAQGLRTEYDEEGNMTSQERYEDGELIEKIK
jgi:hypothetical protein